MLQNYYFSLTSMNIMKDFSVSMFTNEVNFAID
jgi:hypothetical protein